jgi:hypothetical protein
MPDMSDRIIHIGYAKTGTTFLQQLVFPNLLGINYQHKLASKKALYPMIVFDSIDYDLAQVEESLKSLENDQPMLLSEEQLTGSFYQNLACNRTAIAQGLKTLGFNKVIVTIRNQLDALPSLYAQYIHEGGVLPMHDFFSLDEAFHRFNPTFNPGYLCYDRLIHRYHELFGKENVLILLNEELRSDPSGSRKRIADFCGADGVSDRTLTGRDNAALDRRSLAVMRLLNRYTWNRFSPAARLFPAFTSTRLRTALHLSFGKMKGGKISLNADDRRRFAAYYASSNRQLQTFISSDLASFGYPI